MSFCILLNCGLVVLSDTKILSLEIIVSNAIKSKDFKILQLFFWVHIVGNAQLVLGVHVRVYW